MFKTCGGLLRASSHKNEYSVKYHNFGLKMLDMG